MLYRLRALFPLLALSGLLIAASGTAHAQVYRCGSSYSHTPCPGGSTVTVEPRVEIHPDSATAASTARAQRRHEEKDARDWERTERELDKAEAATAPRRATASDRSACTAASQRIEKIDELARRGGSVKQMERLREERQKARDKQFRAGC